MHQGVEERVWTVDFGSVLMTVTVEVVGLLVQELELLDD